MTIDTSKLGWPVAAALAGVLAMGALSGFQGNTAAKFATVDTIKAFNDSPLTTANEQILRDADRTRTNVLQFINQNRAMDPADAKKLADLSIKEKPTPADQAEITRLRTAAEAATQKRVELSTKNPPSDAERTQLAEFGTRSTTNTNLVQMLAGQYGNDVQEMQGDLRNKTMVRVREVVRTVAAKGGYTVVFDTSAAPYAANDITDEVSKVLKK